MALKPKDKPHITEPRGPKPRSDTLVMFGASGDLAKKKLFPAVYRLQQRGLLDIPVVGVALDDWTEAECVEHARQAVKDDGETTYDEKTFEALAANLRYVSGDYSKPETFEKVKAVVGKAEHPVFHLAIPPSLFATVSDGLASVGLNKNSRLIIEKPFGRDLESARELNAHLHANFWESAVFRIDHFLGKEALRSLLITRFANSVLEPLWTRAYVSSVKITMAEAFGVEDRGAFYDSVGALRDVMQNHLLQMVAMFAMEQPVNESAKALRDEKGKVLTAARTVDPAHFVRGQYDGYLDVPGVKKGSDTETYGAFRLDFDSPRWGGVPFYLRAGKALNDTVTEMTIVFAPPPRPLFLDDGSPHPPEHDPHRGQAQQLRRPQLAAEEAGRRHGGGDDRPRPAARSAGRHGPEPYELLIEEAMKGDPTLFAREDSIEESWRVVEPILTEYPKVDPVQAGDVGSAGGPPTRAAPPRLARRAAGLSRPPRADRSACPASRVRRAPRRHRVERERPPHRHDRPPLLPEGVDQAEATAVRLAGHRFALVLVSPLQRARPHVRAGRARRPGRDHRRPARVGLRRLRGRHHRRPSDSTHPAGRSGTGRCPTARPSARSPPGPTG